MTVSVTDTTGTPLGLVGLHQIATAVTTPRPAYRFAFVLDLGAVPTTSSILVGAADAVLHAAFEPVDLQAPPAALSDSDGVVVVELPAPRRVVAVQLHGADFGRRRERGDGRERPHGRIRLFRMDGDAVSEQPTTTAPLGLDRRASVADEFVDARFAIGLDEGPLTTADLAHVTLRSFPTDPRIAVAEAQTLAADPPFFHAAGQLEAGDPAAAVDAGPALAAAVQQRLDGAGLPAPARVAVLVESDAECALRVSAFALPVAFASETFAYGTVTDADLSDASALAGAIAAGRSPVAAYLRGRLGPGGLAEGLGAVLNGGPLYDETRFAGVQLGDETKRRLASEPTGGDGLAALNRMLLQDAFPDLLQPPAASRTLRFPGDAVTGRTLVVELPRGALPTTARVAPDLQLRGDRPAAPDGVPLTTDAHRGVHVGADAWTAVGLEQPEPLAATGIALQLLPLVNRVSISVELRPERDRQPGGQALARGTLTLGAAGASSWASMFLARPKALGTGTVWLLLRTDAGSAVWLGEPEEAALRVLLLGDDASTRETALPALRPSYRIFSRDRAVASKPALALCVADAVVAPDPGGAFDIAATLADAASGPGSGPVAVPLTFTAAVGGTVSVPPPHVEYKLP